MRRLILAVIAALVVVGCSPTGNGVGANFSDASTAIKSTSVDQAMKDFAKVCYGAFPSFSGAYERAKEAGLSKKGPTGSRIHPDTGVSVKIFAGASFRTCSLSFVTPDSQSKYRAALRTPFNATLIDHPNLGKVYASRLEEGGMMLGSVGLEIGNLTQYELVLQVPK